MRAIQHMRVIGQFVPALFRRLEVGDLFDPIEEREHARVHAGLVGLCIGRLTNEHRKVAMQSLHAQGKIYNFTLASNDIEIWEGINSRCYKFGGGKQW